MRKIITFLKTTRLGGALVVLPTWLAVLLVLKALVHLEVIVKPVSQHLPEGVAYLLSIAILLLTVACLLVGAVLRPTFERRVKEAVENTVLEKVPGYTTRHNIAEQIGDLEGNHRFKPALIETADALAPASSSRNMTAGNCCLYSFISDADGWKYRPYRPSQGASG